MSIMLDLENFFNGLTASPFQSTVGSFVNGAPDDLLDYDDRYDISIELPGVPKKDISIEFENNVLTVKAEKKRDYDKEKANRITSYRRYNTIENRYRIPNVIDGDKIDTKYENGVLKITLPKTAEATPKRIAIK